MSQFIKFGNFIIFPPLLIICFIKTVINFKMLIMRSRQLRASYLLFYLFVLFSCIPSQVTSSHLHVFAIHFVCVGGVGEREDIVKGNVTSLSLIRALHTSALKVLFQVQPLRMAGKLLIYIAQQERE